MPYFISPKTEDGVNHEQVYVMPGRRQAIVIITGRNRRDMHISPQETRSIIQGDFYVEVPHRVNLARAGGRTGRTEDSRRRKMRSHELFGSRMIPYQKKRLN